MIWLNQNLQPAEGAFSAQDRGLLLGEAVFETILMKNHAPQFWAEHMQRLWAACAYADIATPYDGDTLKHGAMELLKAAPKGDRHILRVTATGGDGGRGLAPQEACAPNWLLQVNEAMPAPNILHLVETQEPFHLSAPHKTTAYLDNIRARREALRAGGDEAIVFNPDGDLVGAAAGNLFIGHNNRLLTPRTRDGALPGILRQQILKLGSVTLDGQSWHISEAAVSRQMAADAQFILLSNSVMEVVACAYSVGGERGTSKQQAQKMAARLGDDLPFCNL
jgi:branched-chain amino acid aminotransferase